MPKDGEKIWFSPLCVGFEHGFFPLLDLPNKFPCLKDSVRLLNAVSKGLKFDFRIPPTVAVKVSQFLFTPALPEQARWGTHWC